MKTRKPTLSPVCPQTSVWQGHGFQRTCLWEPKLAMAHYMAVDMDEAWEQPDALLKRKMVNFIAWSKVLNNLLRSQHGLLRQEIWQEEVWLGSWSRVEEFVQALLANFKNNPDMNHVHTREAFIKKYEEGGPTVNHPDASWPIHILSSFEDELQRFKMAGTQDALLLEKERACHTMPLLCLS